MKIKNAFLFALTLSLMACGPQRGQKSQNQLPVSKIDPSGKMVITKPLAADLTQADRLSLENFSKRFHLIGVVPESDLPQDWKNLSNEAVVGKISVVRSTVKYKSEYEGDQVVPLIEEEFLANDESVMIVKIPNSNRAFFAVDAKLKSDFEHQLMPVNVSSKKLLTYCRVMHVPHWVDGPRSGQLYMKEQDAVCNQWNRCSYRLHANPAVSWDLVNVGNELIVSRGAYCTQYQNIYEKSEQKVNEYTPLMATVTVSKELSSILKVIEFKL
jgi:hypothetical protein